MLMARPNGEERSISHFLSVYAPVNRATRGSCPPRWLPPGDTTCSQLQVQKEKGLVLWKRQREMKEREKKRRLVLPIAAANHFRWPALSHSHRVPSRRAFGHNCQRPSLKRSRDTRGGGTCHGITSVQLCALNSADRWKQSPWINLKKTSVGQSGCLSGINRSGTQRRASAWCAVGATLSQPAQAGSSIS